MVYRKNGEFLGYLLKDDRIARKKNEVQRLNILQPLMPLTPLQPLRPLQRLQMPSLLYPYEDVYEVESNLKEEKVSSVNAKFDEYLNSSIIAADGKYLGKASKNKYDSESISNPYNNYGNKYNTDSILNPYGEYGGQYGSLSPFNQYSNSPPKLVKDNKIIGYLSINPYIDNSIDPNEFLRWLGLK